MLRSDKEAIEREELANSTHYDPLKPYWETFNFHLSSDSLVTRTSGGKEQKDTSYSNMFFTKYNLSPLLNHHCHRILQLGASTGKFLEPYKNEGWDVLGYDYANASIESMRAKDIPCKQINLCVLNFNLELNYKDELTADLGNTPVNLLAIRLMEYLTPYALRLLIFNLMDAAAPGSVFFIIGSVEPKQIDLDEPNRIPHYIASYFGARTDFFFQQHRLTNDINSKKHVLKSQPNNEKEDDVDEILIVRKGY